MEATRHALEQCQAVVASQPYRLCFVTLSGAHLYGFPSPDSDYDLRGAHLLPLPEVVGLDPGRETIDTSEVRDGVEMDLVTHDVRKFFSLLLRRNGYALEQVYSPLVVFTSPEHEELKEITRGCITRQHHHHYLSFAAHEWQALTRGNGHELKSILYLFRVLLSGIHLMRTGEVEANLPRLNEEFGLPFLTDLMAQKRAGTEKAQADGPGVAYYEREYLRLCQVLSEAAQASALPETPSARAALNDLLVRIRLSSASRS